MLPAAIVIGWSLLAILSIVTIFGPIVGYLSKNERLFLNLSGTAIFGLFLSAAISWGALNALGADNPPPNNSSMATAMETILWVGLGTLVIGLGSLFGSFKLGDNRDERQRKETRDQKAKTARFDDEEERPMREYRSRGGW